MSFDPDKYLASKGAVDDFNPDMYLGSQSAAPQVEDVSSDAIGFGDRFIAKNLAQNTTKQAEFLKQQYPNLDIKVQGSNVLIRKPNESSYKVLDSSSLELADIGDVADVVGAGVASTLGSMGGAAVGALGGGVGAVPGALAGSGLAGAAYEAARQKLGQMAGIPQEVSGTDAAISGAANVAGGALLGTGLKGAGAYKGLIRDAWNKGAPKAASYWFGAPEQVISKYVDDRSAVEAAIPQRSDMAQGVVDRIRTALSGEKRKVGSALGQAIEGADSFVDIAPIKQQYVQYIDDIEKSALNQLDQAQVEESRKQLNQLFKGMPNKISASDAFRLQDQLKDFGDLRRIGTGVNPRFGSSATQGEKELSNLGLQGYQTINKELDRVTEGASPVLKKQYRELMQMQSALSSGTGTPQQAYSTLTNLGGKSKTAFREQLERLANKTGQNFQDDINTLQAAEYFGDAGWVPKSVGGTTSTSRTLPGIALGTLLGAKIGSSMGPGGGVAGAALGAAAGNASASPAMLRAIINNTDMVRAGANRLGQVYSPVVIPVREAIIQSPWDGM